MNHGAFFADGQPAEDGENNSASLAEQRLEPHEMRHEDAVQVRLYLGDPAAHGLGRKVDGQRGEPAHQDVDSGRHGVGFTLVCLCRVVLEESFQDRVLEPGI